MHGQLWYHSTCGATPTISMKTPWAALVPPAKVVLTASGPGSRADTTAELAKPPRSCAIKTNTPRPNGTAPIKHRPRVTWAMFSLVTHIAADVVPTAGLNRPPLTR